MARSIYLFNTHDLPHRAGEMREHQLDLKIPEAVGVDLLSVKTGEIIEVDLRVQSFITMKLLVANQITSVAQNQSLRRMLN